MRRWADSSKLKKERQKQIKSFKARRSRLLSKLYTQHYISNITNIVLLNIIIKMNTIAQTAACVQEQGSKFWMRDDIGSQESSDGEGDSSEDAELEELEDDGGAGQDVPEDLNVLLNRSERALLLLHPRVFCMPIVNKWFDDHSAKDHL